VKIFLVSFCNTKINGKLAMENDHKIIGNKSLQVPKYPSVNRKKYPPQMQNTHQNGANHPIHAK
jgi:hypothetical protein